MMAFFAAIGMTLGVAGIIAVQIFWPERPTRAQREIRQDLSELLPRREQPTRVKREIRQRLSEIQQTQKNKSALRDWPT